jgi:hypothetical protein
MVQYFLDTTWFTNQNIQLNIGNVLVVYTDDGPSGPCGQCMSVTAPHTYLLIYKTEDEFKKDMKNIGRGGKNAKIRFVVIGEWSNQGIFNLEIKE